MKDIIFNSSNMKAFDIEQFEFKSDSKITISVNRVTPLGQQPDENPEFKILYIDILGNDESQNFCMERLEEIPVSPAGERFSAYKIERNKLDYR